MRRWSILVAGATVGVLLTVGLYVMAAPTGIRGPVRIGVVNFPRLIDNYEKNKDIKARFIGIDKAFTAEGRKRLEEIEQLRGKLAMHTPGSDAYRKTEKEAREKAFAFDTWQKMRRSEIGESQKNLMGVIYRSVEKASEGYARANGLSLVLKMDPLNLPVESAREFQLKVTWKRILYVADEIDITDELLAALNAEYRIEKARGAGQ